MAWTVAIVLSLTSLSFLLLFLTNAFDKSKQAIKIFLISLTMGSLIITSQVVHLIIKSKATGDALTNLSTLAVTSLTLTITLFSIMIAIFLIMYTRDILRTAKEAKENKVREAWGDI